MIDMRHQLTKKRVGDLHKPLLAVPLEGQFGTLMSLLMRSARAFLDPGLQMGMLTKEEAKRVLLV